ncbi:hypothetical protein BG015_007556 [Linnemannia schmuckeri]|uniref:Leucine rich repeat domain protein n=1 Tax=Linnemannia schmuckeri TaxID=64567 RepID=A0A9P5S829_9FUNG|nr:hypothetical protein BG015_007556 [Linnemannia schmuckeri]
MDFARSELVQRQPVLNAITTTRVLGAITDSALDTIPQAGAVLTTVYDEYEEEENDELAEGMTTPTRRSNSSIGSPSTSDDFDVYFSTPPPMPTFTHPPSPPRPAYNAAIEHIARRLQPSRLSESAANLAGSHHYNTRTGATVGGDNQSIYKRWFRAQLPDSSATDGPLLDDVIPRRPLTSIAGSNRCLWPPDTTFLTMSTGTAQDLSFQNHDRGFNHHQSINSGATSSSLGSGATSYMMPETTMTLQKNHDRSDSFKDSGECLLDLQPRRKARRTMDGPYFKERNDRMVAGHVQKLIQEAVEDGVGELDLSNLELTDLPPEVRDLNYAIVYNERGSFALSRNRLKLFLSFNQFITIPMHVFELHNLSVLSLRNNNIKAIPPEIGLLCNLVELSIGGNLLEYLPSQIALLPKLHILSIHPNPFMVYPQSEGGIVEQDPAEQQQQQQDFNGDEMDDIGAQQDQQPEGQQQSIPETPTMGESEFVGLQSDDIEMSPAQEQDSQAGPSFYGTDSTGEMDQDEQGQQTAGSVHPQSTTPRMRVQLPPHVVLRSRFPTLAHLAGNVILNYMDTQTTKGGEDESLDRPRKDSKISMEDDNDWLEDPMGPCAGGDVTQDDGYDGHRKQAPTSKKARQVELFKEEIFKEYMTPYLFDIFRRARINNRCAGCQRRFWKPCRIVMVWQDVLGQKRVPVRWKGCGIGTCPGVPETLWPRQMFSSSSLQDPDLAGRSSRVDELPSSSSGAASMAVAS